MQALAFPWLFPYGRGSFNTERLRNVSFRKYSAYLMEYHDGRFLDSTFLFWTLNVTQRKQVAGATMRAAQHGTENGYEVCILCINEHLFIYIIR